MTKSLFQIFLSAFCCMFFCACGEENEQIITPEEDNIPAYGQYIKFQSASLTWEATAESLGSCYVRCPNAENPEWYDLVVCTEDVTDFDIEHYTNHIFLHADLDSLGEVRNFNIIYYKDKNTEHRGDFELMLTKYDGSLSLSRNGDSLSGEFIGKMQNSALPSERRQSRFIFRNIPIEPLN